VRSVLRRDQIDEMKASPVSLMPEKLLDTLSEQELRDLFRYLQADAPKAAKTNGAPQPQSKQK
jgi:cytochrome c553